MRPRMAELHNWDLFWQHAFLQILAPLTVYPLRISCCMCWGFLSIDLCNPFKIHKSPLTQQNLLDLFWIVVLNMYPSFCWTASTWRCIMQALLVSCFILSCTLLELLVCCLQHNVYINPRGVKRPKRKHSSHFFYITEIKWDQLHFFMVFLPPVANWDIKILKHMLYCAWQIHDICTCSQRWKSWV